MSTVLFYGQLWKPYINMQVCDFFVRSCTYLSRVCHYQIPDKVWDYVSVSCVAYVSTCRYVCCVCLSCISLISFTFRLLGNVCVEL